MTLIEMLIVVAIVALLASVVIGLAVRMDNQGKERLTKNTITLIANALEQFRDFGYQYRDALDYYTNLDFPLDFNDFTHVDIQTALEAVLAPLTGPVTIFGVDRTGAAYPVVDEVTANSGCEGLCFFLNEVPQCRLTLEKIDKSLVTTEGIAVGVPVSRFVRIAASDYPLKRIIDPWGTTLRYDYYPDFEDYFRIYGGMFAQYVLFRNNALKTFPVITSAGPDRIFNTRDDISNIDAR